jgi:hypothetical protein
LVHAGEQVGQLVVSSAQDVLAKIEVSWMPYPGQVMINGIRYLVPLMPQLKIKNARCLFPIDSCREID